MHGIAKLLKKFIIRGTNIFVLKLLCTVEMKVV